MPASDETIAAELDDFVRRLDENVFEPALGEQKLTMRHGMKAPWQSLDAHDDQNAKSTTETPSEVPGGVDQPSFEFGK